MNDPACPRCMEPNVWRFTNKDAQQCARGHYVTGLELHESRMRRS